MGCRISEQQIKDLIGQDNMTDADEGAEADGERTESEVSEEEILTGNEEMLTENEEILTGNEEIVTEGSRTEEEKATGGQEYITGEWGMDTPENHGVSRTQIDDLDREIGARPIRAALVIKDGAMIYEYYQEGNSAGTRFDIYSITKSILSATVGIAIDQGYLAGIDTKIEAYLPAIAEGVAAGNIDADMKEITVGNLLSLTSGIEWTETLANGMLMLDWMMAENQVDYILGSNMRNKPGEVFNYNSGDSHLLSALLTEATGMSAKEYADVNMFAPIGIKDYIWWGDSQGISLGGFGIYMTARDAARIGQLYLNKGMWGEERIISEEWITASTQPQGPDGEYGYNWWIDVPDGQQDYQMYYAAGLGGQYIIVVPDYQIVAVFMSIGIDDMSVVSLFKSFVNELEAEAERR